MNFKDFLLNGADKNDLHENVLNYIAQKIPNLKSNQLKYLTNSLKISVDLQNADIRLLSSTEVNNLKKNSMSEFDYLFIYPDEENFHAIGYVFFISDVDFLIGTKYQKKTYSAALKSCIADFNAQDENSRVFCFSIDSKSRKDMDAKQVRRLNSRPPEFARGKDSHSGYYELDKSGYDVYKARQNLKGRLRSRLSEMGLSKYEDIIRDQFTAALDDVFNSDVKDNGGIDKLYKMAKLLKDAKEELSYSVGDPKKFLELMKKF